MACSRILQNFPHSFLRGLVLQNTELHCQKFQDSPTERKISASVKPVWIVLWRRLAEKIYAKNQFSCWFSLLYWDYLCIEYTMDKRSWQTKDIKLDSPHHPKRNHGSYLADFALCEYEAKTLALILLAWDVWGLRWVPRRAQSTQIALRAAKLAASQCKPDILWRSLNECQQLWTNNKIRPES